MSLTTTSNDTTEYLETNRGGNDNKVLHAIGGKSNLLALDAGNLLFYSAVGMDNEFELLHSHAARISNQSMLGVLPPKDATLFC